MDVEDVMKSVNRNMLINVSRIMPILDTYCFRNINICSLLPILQNIWFIGKVTEIVLIDIGAILYTITIFIVEQYFMPKFDQDLANIDTIVYCYSDKMSTINH